MNKTNKTILGIGIMALVLGASGLIASNTEAYRGDPSVKGPDCSEERHTDMLKAFETKDYTAWKNLMEGKGRVTEVVNKDNFARFAEAHRVAQTGDIEGAKKIRQELGLGLGQGRGKNNPNENIERGLGRKNSFNQ
jgi:hypothetical protein